MLNGLHVKIESYGEGIIVGEPNGKYIHVIFENDPDKEKGKTGRDFSAELFYDAFELLDPTEEARNYLIKKKSEKEQREKQKVEEEIKKIALIEKEKEERKKRISRQKAQENQSKKISIEDIREKTIAQEKKDEETSNLLTATQQKELSQAMIDALLKVE